MAAVGPDSVLPISVEGPATLPGTRFTGFNPSTSSMTSQIPSPTLPLTPVPVSSSSDGASNPATSTSTSTGSSGITFPLSVMPFTPSSSVAASQTSASSSAAPSSTTVAFISHSHTGAIIGGVIGGVAALLLAIAAALFYLRLKRQIPSRSRPRSIAEIGRSDGGKWNGLSSRDSTMEGGFGSSKHISSKPKKYGHEQTDSTGMIVSANNSSLGHGKEQEISEEDIATFGEERKVARRRSEYIETVPPLPFHDRRGSVASTLAGSPPLPSSDNGGFRRGRVSSSSQSQRAVALAKLDTNSPSSPSSPVSPYNARPQSVDSSTYAGRPLSADALPPMLVHGTANPPSAEEAQRMNRTSSGGAVRRNPARKPVPSYHSLASTASAQSDAAVGTGTGTSAAPMEGGPPARGPSRSQSREDIARAPHLNPKSSFGDMRRMHYLVPDMPPPTTRD
ncbi:hypothetical protein AcV5_000163 [Taiwanofungus camphoratus]|nr:hypothetical protein AcV5_000163 [Antrodia cinnamomea]